MKIAYTDTFQKSVNKLGAADQPSVWRTVSELACGNDDLPGLHVEPLHNTQDNFLSLIHI